MSPDFDTHPNYHAVINTLVARVQTKRNEDEREEQRLRDATRKREDAVALAETTCIGRTRKEGRAAPNLREEPDHAHCRDPAERVL
jgi:hypothetical protein